nr:alcohol dehydrogenase catalytic domain-containing protein [Pseudotabrizicola sediminis]
MIGHGPVGGIVMLSSAVQAFAEEQRVIAGVITPSMWSNACQSGRCSPDGAGTKHGCKPLGGWKFSKTINGAKAEYILV